LTWILLFISLVSLLLVSRRSLGAEIMLGIFTLLAGFLVGSFALRRRCRWAVPTLMIFSSIAIVGLSGFIFFALEAGELFLAGVFGLCLATMIEFMFHLSKATKGIDAEMIQGGQMHGFEPILKPAQVPKIPKESSTENT